MITIDLSRENGLSFERRHASAHDLVDEEEVGSDHRTRIQKLNFHSVRSKKEGKRLGREGGWKGRRSGRRGAK